MAIKSPHSARPSELDSPVPQAEAPQIEPGKYSFPDMEITADQRALAGSAAPQQQLSPEEMALLESAGSGQLSPEEQAALGELDQMSPEEIELLKSLDGSGQYGPPNPFAKEMSKSIGGIQDVFIGENDEYFVRDIKGGAKKISKDKAEDISRFNEAMNYPLGRPKSAKEVGVGLAETGIQAGLGVAGEIAGGVIGSVAGPIGASVGAGLGAGAGNVLGGLAADYMKILVGIDNKEKRNQLIDFFLGAVGSGVGQGVSALASRNAQRLAAESDQIGRAADTGLETEALARQAGVELTPEQALQAGPLKTQASEIAGGAYGKTSQIELDNIRAMQDRQVMDSFNNIRQKINPNLVSDPTKKVDFGVALDDWTSGQRNAIDKVKKEAFKKGEGRLFNVDQLESEVKKEINNLVPIYDDMGRPKLAEFGAKTESELANKYDEIRPLYTILAKLRNAKGRNLVEAPPSTIPGFETFRPNAPRVTEVPRAGVSLEEFDQIRKEIGNLANFQGRIRTPTENRIGRLYRSTADLESDFISRVLGPNNPMSEELLRLNSLYSNNIENVEAFKRLIKENPTDAARVLVDPKSPESINSLKAVLSESEFNELGEGLLTSLANKYTEAGEKSFNAQSLFNDFEKIDPKVRSALYGDKEGDLKALFRVASLIEKSKRPVSSVADSSVAKKFIEIAMRLKGVFNGNARFVYDLLKGNPSAQDFLSGKVTEMYTKDIARAKGLAAGVESTTAKQAGSIPFRFGMQGVVPNIDKESTKNNFMLRSR